MTTKNATILWRHDILDGKKAKAVEKAIALGADYVEVDER
jgi:hypothetical protein